MKIKYRILSILLCVTTLGLRAQAPEIYPPHWWTGMKHNNIQLLVKSTDAQFGKSDVTIQYNGVTLTKVNRLENGKYLALDIAIAPEAAAGNAVILFKNGKKTQKVNFPLKARDKNRVYAQGVTSADFIYLAMPDRFSNGDPTNDKV